MFDPDLLLTLGAAVLAVVIVLLAYLPPSVCVLAIVTPRSGRFPFLSFARWTAAVFLVLNTVLSLAAPHRFPLISDLIALAALVVLLLVERKPHAARNDLQHGPAR